MNSNNKFEVIVISGSYVGLSAAMILGRSLRKALVIGYIFARLLSNIAR